MVVVSSSPTNWCVRSAHWRFLYFHGQDSARLERHKTVYTHPDRERTLLITSLSPLLFLAPEGYLRELEKVWIDDVIFERDWRNFISGLLKEWEQLILSVCLRCTQTRILMLHANDITVDRGTFSKCWFPRHPRRGRFQSQQQYNRHKPGCYFHISRANRQLHVDSGQRWRHCDRLAPSSPQQP